MNYKDRCAIAIMAKQPGEGNTKTRLCPPLTFKEAAEIYRALLEDTIHLVANLPHIDLAVAISPIGSRPFFEEISPPGTILIEVEGANLGICLAQTLKTLFDAGYTRAALLNSDGPSIPPGFIIKGFEQLNDSDLVLGPGHDGGYYFIGMKRLYYELFSDISWSTNRVLYQTLASSNRLHLRTAVLPAWYDVDTAHDLDRLQAELMNLPENQLPFTRKAFGNLHLKN